MNRDELKASISDFPTSSGVYLMRNKAGKIIYVGKAKKLRNRVRSYFSASRDKKTSLLVEKIDAIDFVVTDNEYEALLLENNLIKEYNPRYNINLRDGKTYPVIRITADEYPRIFRTRNIIKDGSQYFGPFADVRAIDTYLGIVDALLPLRKCSGRLKKRGHPCLYYHIGKCPGPCAGLIGKADYAARVEDVRRLLGSSSEEIRRDIGQKMAEASAQRLFEKAAEFRDSLHAMETMENSQAVNDFDTEARDYIACHSHDGLISFVVFQMRQGKLVGTDIFRNRNFDGSEERYLEQFIMRYYEDMRAPPATVYVNSIFDDGGASRQGGERGSRRGVEGRQGGGRGARKGGRGGEGDRAARRGSRGGLGREGSRVDSALLERFFTKQQGVQVRIGRPESERDRRLLQMAKENARRDSVKRAREIGDEEGIAELQKIFKLPTLPRRIEGFDIAHLQGKYTVASLVSFKNGVPDKKEYRYFNMRTTQGKIDDYESMREVVARRYSKLLNEKKALPDLILLDGGKGQLSAACQILEGLGLKGLPILSLAKQREEIFLPGHSQGVILPPGTPALRVLQALRDEAHRFATSHRAAAQARDIRLQQLEEVPGIGQKRAKRLLEFSGSLDKLATTPPSKIAEACAISKELAQRVLDAIGKM